MTSPAKCKLNDVLEMESPLPVGEPRSVGRLRSWRADASAPTGTASAGALADAPRRLGGAPTGPKVPEHGSTATASTASLDDAHAQQLDERPHTLARRAQKWADLRKAAIFPGEPNRFADPQAALELSATQVERLRRRFPKERVAEARRILGMGDERRLRGARFEDDLAEQIYRTHYSSVKLQRSWNRTVRATYALGRLFDVLTWDDVRATLGHDEEPGTLRRVFLALWPGEKLEEVLPEPVDESSPGHLPLGTGARVLGLRLVVHEYAWRVLDVLHRLHRDDSYTFGLCVGRKLSWDEAMVFKTLPH